MKKNRVYYELNPSQEVVKMQLLFSIDKRVINILSSTTSDEVLDVDIMRQSISLAFMRNDCMHIKFVKRRKLMQYFDDEATCPVIPYLEFATKEEQEKFIAGRKKKAIRYKHGKVVEFYICKTYDNKFMFFVKICHLNADLYGLNIFYKDVFDIYDSLKNGKPLPKPLPKFEDVLKKDLQFKHNEKIKQRNYEFFSKYMGEREEPYYAGMHGNDGPISKKDFHRRTMRMFFLRNKTKSYMKTMDIETCKKIIAYCEQNKVTPANFLFYATTLAQSKLNGNVKNQLQLELSNCRATAIERNVAGTKAQSLGCYITLEPEEKLSESFENFCKNQTLFYRHLGFSDFDFQMLTHRIWKSSNLRTYYANSFSFVPMMSPEGIDFQAYSNGKFALPCYFAIMFNVNTYEMKFIYDCQIKLFNDDDVDRFHKNLEHIVDIMLSEKDPYLKEIKAVGGYNEIL